LEAVGDVFVVLIFLAAVAGSGNVLQPCGVRGFFASFYSFVATVTWFSALSSSLPLTRPLLSSISLPPPVAISFCSLMVQISEMSSSAIDKSS
jgi:hypothetical protein